VKISGVTEGMRCLDGGYVMVQKMNMCLGGDDVMARKMNRLYMPVVLTDWIGQERSLEIIYVFFVWYFGFWDVEYFLDVQVEISHSPFY